MKNFLLFFFFLICAGTSVAQIEVVQYNAEWNSSNSVEWCEDLTDCETDYIDIVEKPKQQEKNNITVVPTIIVFDDGEEVKRYQADISFTIKATREELQDFIDELIMSKF